MATTLALLMFAGVLVRIDISRAPTSGLAPSLAPVEKARKSVKIVMRSAKRRSGKDYRENVGLGRESGANRDLGEQLTARVKI